MKAFTNSQANKKIGVVIGAGSVMCAASIGLFEEFDRNGIDISMVVGSSAGSIYASAYALGFPTEKITNLSTQVWRGELFEGYASNLRTVLAGDAKFNEKSGLIDDQPLNRSLQEIFTDQSFTDTSIHLYIVATELFSGESFTMTTGRIFDAIRASIAIPLIFPPWQIGEKWFVDGAVSKPLPVDVAIKEGSDIIIAMGFKQPTRDRMRSYTAVTTHFNSIYMNNILKSNFAFHNAVHHAEIIPIIPEFERRIGTFDIEAIPYIIEAGRREAKENIGYIKQLLD